MKKINYRSPRYILPLIMLPFLVAINWLVLDAFPASRQQEYQAAREAFDRLNTKIPEASLSSEDVSTKFEAIKKAFKGRFGLSAINDLERRHETLPGTKEEYEKYDAKDWIDSLPGLVPGRIAGTAAVKKEMEANTRYKPASYGLEKALVVSPSGNRTAGTGPANNSPADLHRKEETAGEEELRIWKAQMLLLDSLTRTPEERIAEMAIAREKETLKALAVLKAKEEERTLPVRKGEKKDAHHFNTIQKKKEDTFIKAMIDEDIMVVAGSRIRVRVMDEMDVGGFRLEKGAYVYAMVSAFSHRRVYLSVGSVLAAGGIRKVDLEVYGNDGIKGLYVPKSDFTTFTKDLGSSLSTGSASDISVEEKPGSLNRLLFGVAETGIQATGKAAAKAARKNRAKLKYNTILFLVNANEI